MQEDERQWYMIHTYTGREAQVQLNLEQRVKSMDVDKDIGDVIIPTVEEIEIKEGQRRTVSKKLYPGYVLVKMRMNNNSWSIVRNTPGVTSFVSNQDEQGKLIPAPLEEEEVATILAKMKAGAPQVTVGLTKGESVRITDGPFIDFAGIIDEISPEKGKVRVLVSFFGRETPIELDFLQVEKL
ncbi:MAG: transcription termination/antitermination factor NusG [Chloroflexi bacterium]|nr:transcription termination/antitermination factor NusG [Chloroflexota bacterium]